MTKLVAWARQRHGGDLVAAVSPGRRARRIRAAAARMRLVQFGAGLERARGDLAARRSIGQVVIATVTLSRGLSATTTTRREHNPDPDRRRDAEWVLEDLRSLCRAAQAHDEHDEKGAAHRFSRAAAGLHVQEVDAAS